MIKRAMLSLPMLLAGASCTPPEIGPASASSRQLSYVDLASMDVSTTYEYVLPTGAAGAIPAALPVIDPVAIAPGSPAKPFEAKALPEADGRRALDCLTTAVYHEARSESEDGQRAVAQVVLNRARHPAYPQSVCGVVYQGSQRRTGCQFSFTCDGSLARRIEPGAWARARAVADAALSGSVYEPVGLATHYHTTAIRPWWAASLTRAITVGSHIFYRWRGSWGQPLAFRQQHAGVEPDAAFSSATTTATPDADNGIEAVAPLVRMAVLVDNGGKVNVHRTGPRLAIAQSVAAPTNSPVRIHRTGASSAPAGAETAAEPASALPVETVAATD
jgi:hypothetical protein